MPEDNNRQRVKPRDQVMAALARRTFDRLPIKNHLPADIAEAYVMAAEKSVLAALTHKEFFGYFSVCADGKGHGNRNTYPGLDWGQSAEALLWLGRTAEVLSSWDHVMGHLRADGLLPFAILPELAGTTSMVNDRHPLVVDARGAVFEHWVPGNPLRTLANVTAIVLLHAIFAKTRDRGWLAQQGNLLRALTGWLGHQVSAEGLVAGGGFYLERPTRLEYDGVNQCYTAHAFSLAATLFRELGDAEDASRCEAVSGRIVACFRQRFWAGDHCVEYLHPERGTISSHGLTDVDWAAVATGAASAEQCATLWPQLKDNADFLYSGVPTGIATRPETYEDWEMQHIDRHDLSAMGRVWYLECWARARMDDRDGLLASLRRVIQAGRENDGYWFERYYSEKTGNLAAYMFNTYCEYPANLIRIVNRFLLNPTQRQPPPIPPVAESPSTPPTGDCRMSMP